jgi:hypothetical protein
MFDLKKQKKNLMILILALFLLMISVPLITSLFKSGHMIMTTSEEVVFSGTDFLSFFHTVLVMLFFI